MEGVPAHGRGVESRWSLRSLPTRRVLGFYDLPINTDCCIFIVVMQSVSYRVLSLKHKSSVFTVTSIIVLFLKSENEKYKPK